MDRPTKTHVPFNKDNVLRAARKGVAEQFNYAHIAIVDGDEDDVLAINKDTMVAYRVTVTQASDDE